MNAMPFVIGTIAVSSYIIHNDMCCDYIFKCTSEMDKGLLRKELILRWKAFDFLV
jgi:hypothetical protein